MTSPQESASPPCSGMNAFSASGMPFRLSRILRPPQPAVLAALPEVEAVIGSQR
jgi:hypothetical protein